MQYCYILLVIYTRAHFVSNNFQRNHSRHTINEVLLKLTVLLTQLIIHQNSINFIFCFSQKSVHVMYSSPSLIKPPYLTRNCGHI